MLDSSFEDKIIKNEKLIYSIMNYLSYQDILNLTLTNKRIHNEINDKNLLVYKISKESSLSLGEILFKKESYFEEINQEIFQEISKKSDKIFSDFYKTSNRHVFTYFFCLLIFGIDMFTLFLAVKEEIIDNKKWLDLQKHWFLLSPLIILWIISIVFLSIYHTLRKKIKKQVFNLVYENRKKIIGSTEEKLRGIYENLKFRTRYSKRQVYESFLKAFITIFVPLMLKVSLFHSWSYQNFFVLSSSLFYYTIFINDVVCFIISKYKKNKSPEINSFEYFEDKAPNSDMVKNIRITVDKYKSSCSETEINLVYFINGGLIGVLIVFYFREIGKKIDNMDKDDNAISWIVLFIPIFLLLLSIIGYIILHIYSLHGIVKKYYIVLVATIIPTIISIIICTILVPLELERKITISYFCIPGLYSIGIICLGIHLLVLNKSMK